MIDVLNSYFQISSAYKINILINDRCSDDI